MSVLKIVGFIALSGIFSSLALADDESLKLEKLYVDSGLEILINYMPTSVKQGIENEKKQFPRVKMYPLNSGIFYSKKSKMISPLLA